MEQIVFNLKGLASSEQKERLCSASGRLKGDSSISTDIEKAEKLYD
jgi:hypothetical protein